MTRIVKGLTFFILGLTLLLSLIIIATYLYSNSPISHVHTLRAPHGLVKVNWDQYGIPHINAEADDLDAFYALGYIHAQDRFWQMEMQRRIVQGRLSEIYGAAAVDKDKYLRTWGFYRAAKQTLKTLDKPTRRVIHSYTTGVNAYLKKKRYPLPVRLLRYTPDQWTDVDTIAWQKMMAWDLQSTWEQKLKNYLVTKQLGADQVPVLLPPYPQQAPTTLSNADIQQSGLVQTNKPQHIEADVKLAKLLDDTASIREQLGMADVPGKGSNNWVISGKHTITGKPILANDPHLKLNSPALWYLVDLKGPDLHVVGATIPGMPMVIIGHNDHIAWGVTNVNPDVQELYIEPKNAKLTKRIETIKVKGADDIEFPVYTSEHGPIISNVTTAKQAGANVAIHWTALMPGDTTAQSFLKVDYARNWQQFVTALADYVAPSQNFVYADTQGNIGYYLPGKIPLRQGCDGSLPIAPGQHCEWTGYIPFNQLPHVYNPPEGMIVSGNNRSVPDNYPYSLTFRWYQPPYRAQRILDGLQAKTKLSIHDMGEIQNDTSSYLWRSLKPYLLATKPNSHLAHHALDTLKNWDGDMNTDSSAASLFVAWYRELSKMGAQQLGEKHWNEPLFIIQQLKDNGPYCRINDAKDCQALLTQSLATAIKHLSTLTCNKVSCWRWGKIHKLHLVYQGIGESDTIGWLWNRTIATPGGKYTVNPGSFDDTLQQTNGASYRQIIDLNDMDNSRYVYPMGQSANPFNQHFKDLLSLWRDGKYIKITSQK